MFQLLAASPVDGVELGLFLALLVVVILIGIAAIVSAILQLIIAINYWVTDRESTAAGYTGETAAKAMLAKLGYTDISVEKAGLFRALIYGNHYNPKKKTVYLRASTYNRNNVTSVGLALQKVGLAAQDKKDGSVRARWRLQKIGIFGPILFIPIVIIGAGVDLGVMFLTDGNFTGIGTLIATLIGVAYFIAAFVLTILNIKVEKKANEATLALLREHDFMTDYEIQKLSKVFKTYILAYVANFIISLLELIRVILKIALTVVASNNRK